jgi:hypothetical protein
MWQTGGKWKKPSSRKVLIILFGHLWVLELTYVYIHFCLQIHFKVSAAWYCCHYLPPVSTTLAKMVEKFATGVADIGGRFATGVVDTGSNFAAAVVDTGGKFAPVSLIPVVHLDSRISLRIFAKNLKLSKWNTLGLGGN